MKTTTELFQEITEKVKNNIESSGSVSLLKSGRTAILKKLFEESAEVWMACTYEKHDQKVLEISQYLYYVIVFAINSDLSSETVITLLSEFESEYESEHWPQPNKQLIHLTTELAAEKLSADETADKIKSILSILRQLMKTNNLTNTDIFNKL